MPQRTWSSLHTECLHHAVTMHTVIWSKAIQLFSKKILIEIMDIHATGAQLYILRWAKHCEFGPRSPRRNDSPSGRVQICLEASQSPSHTSHPWWTSFTPTVAALLCQSSKLSQPLSVQVSTQTADKLANEQRDRLQGPHLMSVSDLWYLHQRVAQAGRHATWMIYINLVTCLAMIAVKWKAWLLASSCKWTAFQATQALQICCLIIISGQS